MPAPWKSSHEVILWQRLDPAQATHVMLDCYGNGAGAEVLLRAFLEERDMNPSAVQFWLRVYEQLKDRVSDGTEEEHPASRLPR